MDPEQPFFLYFALPSPQYLWLPLPQFEGKSRAGTYGDYVVQVDAMIGSVLAAIESSGQANNTLVILTSDHGADWRPNDITRWNHHSNAQWRSEKADIWQGGTRVPFIARWPSHIPANSVCDEMGSLTDLLATLAYLTNTTLPSDAEEDSFNLSPALLGEPHAAIRKVLVSESNDGRLSIRENDWKLELGLGSGCFSKPRRVQPEAQGSQGQLYNLRNDPGETDSQWLNKPELAHRLTALLEDHKNSGTSAA